MRFEKTYRRAIREIRSASNTAQSAKRSPKKLALSAALVGAGAIALVFGLVLPNRAQAKDLERIADALGAAQTYHMTFTSCMEGLNLERWKDGKRTRYR